MTPGTVDTLITLGEVIGLCLAAYGTVREGLAKLAEPRPYGEGRYGEGVYGGARGRWTRRIIRAGVVVRLLPSDAKLTRTDHKRNAVLAISGAFVGLLALLADLAW
jgi:hypothetical protein